MKSLFDTFSARSEYDSWITDRYGRQRLFTNSALQVFEPVVAGKLFELGLKPFYPNNKKFAFCLSHDIDLIYQHLSGFQRIKNLFNPTGLKSYEMVKYNLSSLFKKKIYPFYSLNKLSDIDQSWNIKATYFFLALSKTDEDFNYGIHELHSEIKHLKALDNEIGLHGGHNSYNNLSNLLREKKLFEDVTGIACNAYRNHYLKFDIKQTWQNLQQANFVYDTTYGYPDCAGFRNGMCYPFFPYDITNKKFLDIIELPLIAMDATFFYYMRLDFSMIKKIIKYLILKVSEIGGVFTLLWHNNNLHGDYDKLYKEILEIILLEEPWVATSYELVQWWKSNGLLDKQRQLMTEYFELQSQVSRDIV